MLRQIAAYGISTALLFALVVIFNHTQQNGIETFDRNIGWWTSKITLQELSKLKRSDVDELIGKTWSFARKEETCCGNLKGIQVTFSPILDHELRYEFYFYPSGQIKYVTRSTWGEIVKIATFNEDGSSLGAIAQ